MLIKRIELSSSLFLEGLCEILIFIYKETDKTPLIMVYISSHGR